MKIKQAAELTFDEPVNQPILSVTRTAIQLRQQMRQPVSPPETDERVQAVKDFKEKNEF
jgi:CHASE3 domain sensor protein